METLGLLSRSSLVGYLCHSVIVAGGLSLLAIWAGWSRRHWFLRAMLVCASLMPFPPVRAYSLCLLFLFVLPVIALIVLVLRRCMFVPGGGVSAECGSREGRLRYGLRDVFLAVMVSSIVAAIGTAAWRSQPDIKWLGLLVSGGCLAAIAALAAVVVLIRSGRAWSCLALAVVLAGAVALHTWVVDDWLDLQAVVVKYPPGTPGQLLLCFALGFTEFAGLIAFTIVLSRFAFGDRAAIAGKWRRFFARGVLLVGLLVFFVPVARVYRYMLDAPRPPEQSCPSANSYPHLLSLAEELHELNPTESTVAYLKHQTQNTEKARQIESLRTELVSLAAQPGHVPVELSSARYADALSLAHLTAFRSVSRMLENEALAATNAGRFDEACGFALASVQIGNTLGRGGLLVDSEAGAGLTGAGVWNLMKMCDGLSLARVRSLLVDLQRIEQLQEPVDVAAARSAAWDDQALGWLVRYERAIYRLMYGTDRPVYGLEEIKEAARRNDGLVRRLKTALAIRLFQEDHARLPDRLEELVPDYLAAMPIDPVSNQPLVYHRTDTGYVLYSVRWD